MDSLPVLTYGTAAPAPPPPTTTPTTPTTNNAAAPPRRPPPSALDVERARKRLALAAVESLLENGALSPPTVARVTAPLTGDELLAAAEERALAGACGAPRCGARVTPARAARPKRLPGLAGVPAADGRFCGAECAAATHALAASLGGPADAAVRAGLVDAPAATATHRGATERAPGLAAGTRDVPILRSTVVERAASSTPTPVATPPAGGAAAAVEGFVPRAAAASTATASTSTPRAARLRKNVSWRDDAPGGRLATVRRVGGADDAPGLRAAVEASSSSDDDDGAAQLEAGPSSSAAAAAVIEFELDDGDDDVGAQFGRLKISAPAPLADALADLDLSDAAPSDRSRSPSPPPLPPPDDLTAMLAARDAAAAADLAAWRDRLAADDAEAVVPQPPPPPPPRAPRAPARRVREPTSPGTPERSVRRARGGSPVSPSGSEGEEEEVSDDDSLTLGTADAWMGAPPPGYTRPTLSTFGGVAAALDGWATDGTRALLADAAAPPPRHASDRAAAAALGAPLARGLTPILAALRISVPRSTIEAALADVVATFAQPPVPPLSEPQWAATALTLTKALSLAKLRTLAPAFEGRDALGRVSVLLARLGLTVEGFQALLDVVMEADA